VGTAATTSSLGAPVGPTSRPSGGPGGSSAVRNPRETSVDSSRTTNEQRDSGNYMAATFFSSTQSSQQPQQRHLDQSAFLSSPRDPETIDESSPDARLIKMLMAQQRLSNTLQQLLLANHKQATANPRSLSKQGSKGSNTSTPANPNLATRDSREGDTAASTP
ncbi:unnamed protein product, partial [Amoebophrya sp. A120]